MTDWKKLEETQTRIVEKLQQQAAEERNTPSLEGELADAIGTQVATLKVIAANARREE